MDAKDLRTGSALGDRGNNASTKYPQGSAVLQCNRNKPYQDVGSNSLAKVDVPTSRPCAVIGPDRVVPPPVSTDAYLKKAPPEPWAGADNIYRHPPEYPNKISDYRHPTRNISPRQTFQENMQRIMVPPSFNSVKLKEDHNFPVDPNISPLRNTLNMPNEAKYCDVPYPVNPLTNEQKTVRNSDINVSNMNATLIRSAPVPQGWPPGSANIRPSKPYSAPDLYQYPDYTSCAGPQPVLMPRTQRTIHGESGHVYSDTYYQDGSVRFKPYPPPPVKERYPQARYEYIGNYSNPYQPPPSFPSHKYDLQKPGPPHPYPGYSQVPLKYLEPRMAEPIMNGYQRPLNQQSNFNAVPFRNQVIHPNYGTVPVPGNCLQTNKFYPYPPDNTKVISSNKLPYNTNNKIYAEYENNRPKPYPLPDSFYLNEISRSHPMKGQVLPPSYSSVNLHSMPSYPYYRKDNPTMKNYEVNPHFRNIDPTMNTLSRLPSQFSPNAIAISPSDSNTSNDTTQTQAIAQEDYGYVSQSSSTSIRSMDSGINRIPNDFYRRYDYRYGPIVKASPLLSRADLNPNNNIGSKNKQGIDVRQFLQMWNESEDENGESNNKEITSKTKSANDITNQEQLYVLGLVHVPSEELSKYEHIQKVSKLPENIKGYNSIELLNQFEEVIESSNLNNFNVKPPMKRDFHDSIKGSMLHGIRMPQRPISPLDVEAKISQSVIHKEVGCNFEIRPCSPKMLNVQVATPAQTVLGERVIEKVTNKLISPSPVLGNVIENMDFCNIAKHQDSRIASNENTKAFSCKMNNTEFNPNDSVKTNYSLQDLESNSGVCLASLPRLDNDIELSFPEVNQQFINANKVESVITSAPKDLPALDLDHSNRTQDRDVQENEVGQFPLNTEFEKEFAKLSKYRKLKRKGSESKESTPEPNAQSMRTDSVIIKNPENMKSQDDIVGQSCLPIKKLVQDAQQNPINLTVQERANSIETNLAINEILKDSAENDIAIDFSVNSNDHCGIKNSVQNKANSTFSDDIYVSKENHSRMQNTNDSSADSNHFKVNKKESTNIIPDKSESSECAKGTSFEMDTKVFSSNDSLSHYTTEALPSNIIKNSTTSDSNLICDNSKLHMTRSSDVECLNKVCLINEDSSGLNDILLFPNNVSVPTDSVLSDVRCEEDMLFRDITYKQDTLNDEIKNKLNAVEVKNKCSSSTMLTRVDNQICQPETTDKMLTNSHKIDVTIFEQLSNNEEKCDVYGNTACLSKILCHINKELFSPWFQKLILYNEGMCASFPPNKLTDTIFDNTRKNILINTTTTAVDETALNNKIDILAESTDFSIQELIPDNQKTISSTGAPLFGDFKDSSGIEETNSNKTKDTNEIMVDNDGYDLKSNNNKIAEDVIKKMDINFHEEIDNNVCKEMVDTNTCKTISETEASSSCLETLKSDSFDNPTTNKRRMETDHSDYDYSCPILETSENEPRFKDMVDDKMIIHEQIMKTTNIMATDIHETLNKSTIETPETNLCADNTLSDSKTCQDDTFENSILKTNETNVCVGNATTEQIFRITENDSLVCGMDVDAMSIKPISNATKSDSCVIDTAFDSSSNSPYSPSTDNNDCTEKSENQFDDTVEKVIHNTAESYTNNAIDDASSDLISEPSEFMGDSGIVRSTMEQIILETTKEASCVDKEISSSNNLNSKSSETYFSIEDTLVNSSTQNKLHFDITNKNPNSDNKLVNTISKLSETIEDTMLNNNKIEVNVFTAEIVHDVIDAVNTSNALVLNGTEDTLAENGRSPNSETAGTVDKTANKSNSETTKTISYNVDTVFNQSNTSENIVLKHNLSGDTAVNTSITTKTDHIVKEVVSDDLTNNVLSTTLNNLCSENSQTVSDIFLETAVKDTAIKLVSNDTEANNISIDINIKKTNLEVACFDKEGRIIDTEREKVSQVLVGDKCYENVTCKENENIVNNMPNLQNIHNNVNNKTVELNSTHNTYDETITELNKFSPEEDSSICQMKYDELETELEDNNSNIQNISGFDAQRHLFPFISDTDSELKCVVNLKDVTSYRCEESSMEVSDKIENVSEEENFDKKHRNYPDSPTNDKTIDEGVYDATFESPQELLEYCNLKQSEIDTCDAIPLEKSQLCDPFKYMRYRNNQILTKKQGALKRSLSDSALHDYNIDDSSKQDNTVSRPFLWQNKRKKLIGSEKCMERHFITEGYCNIIHHNRRNSLSATYNEENVSFCILIDDNCIITEEDDETDKMCFTDIPEDCISCMPNDATNADENTEVEMSPNTEINCDYSDPFALDCTEEKSLDETWVEDVACIETVISDDIVEDIIASSPQESDLSDDESNNTETNIYDVSDHTDKVKYIYGDEMCSNDAQLLETLYRTPQMDVNKTLVCKESQVTDDCSRYYDKETLEEVLSESNAFKTSPSKLGDKEFVKSVITSPDTIKGNEKREIDVNSNNFESYSSILECSNSSYIIPEMKCGKIEEEDAQIIVVTPNHTVNSCESSVDNVFSYNQRVETPLCTISSSPEVSSTTEEKNSSILLKITNYKGSRIAQVSDKSDSKRNTVCCKYTENQEYIHYNSNLPSRPLLTKAAQKYIPPLKETIRDLKVKLPLPPHSLTKLKQLKISKEEPKPNFKVNNIVNIGKKEIPKKTKPKFEDVLKSIDEIQFQMHKEKSKKVKKSIPKVVIKKNGNGSHYASTSNKDKYNPDLTGRKWQPWVFIETNSFIDKMARQKKYKAIFNHRKNKFVFAETFKKYRSIGSTKFVISQPRTDDSSLGQLKYTIKLKHS